MGLTLNGEQIELMRSALIEYQRGMRDQERYHCAGPSSVGIELCRRRALLESILSEIEHQNGSPKVQTLRPAHRLRLVPTIEPDYAA
jgi:hypothetical protein